MSTSTGIGVCLPPGLQEFIRDRVAGGRFQTLAEVVREGLRKAEDQLWEVKLRIKDFIGKAEGGHSSLPPKG
jgi:putative addiction module CopG family antidote